jgi:type II secretory pathway component PulC
MTAYQCRSCGRPYNAGHICECRTERDKREESLTAKNEALTDCLRELVEAVKSAPGRLPQRIADALTAAQTLLNEEKKNR